MAGELEMAHLHPWASPRGALKLCVVEIKLLGSEKHVCVEGGSHMMWGHRARQRGPGPFGNHLTGALNGRDRVFWEL